VENKWNFDNSLLTTEIPLGSASLDVIVMINEWPSRGFLFPTSLVLDSDPSNWLNSPLRYDLEDMAMKSSSLLTVVDG
jgi:hypothetical protein